MISLSLLIADKGNWNVEVLDDGSLVAKKIGEQYRIATIGDLEGDGHSRELLEDIVSQYNK